jgi:hypothetical protein
VEHSTVLLKQNFTLFIAIIIIIIIIIIAQYREFAERRTIQVSAGDSRFP